jgi:ribosomal protein S1
LYDTLKQVVLNFFKIVPKKNDNYLELLIRNLENIKTNNLRIPVTIQAIRPKGFLVKAGGLFGFIPFKHMPWQYKNLNTWQSIARYLIGQKFFCFIHSIETNPIRIKIDGKAHKFILPELEDGVSYNAIVISKTKYGLFLEMGYNFNWRYGSVVGLFHKSAFVDITEYENAVEGDVITTYFHGYNEDNNPILGDFRNDNFIFITGKYKSFIGTIKEVTVKKTANKKWEFFVEDQYPANLSVNKRIYPGNKNRVLKIVAAFKDNEKITCQIIGISQHNNRFQLKLAAEYYETKKL